MTLKVSTQGEQQVIFYSMQAQIKILNQGAANKKL